jgi:GntR family transcriptional regulator
MATAQKVQKYQKIKQDILSMINSDKFQIGDKLDGEIVLCERLNVSRATLRQALKELETEGYIKRRQGNGTIIEKKESKIIYPLTRLGRLADLLDENCRIETIMIKITDKKASKIIAEKLHIKEGTNVIEYERVRSINGIPAVYSIDNIAKDRIPESARFENMGPSLSQAVGIDLRYTDARLVPCTANSKIATALKIPIDTLCIMLEETSYDANGKPLDFSHEYYPAMLFDFTIKRS